MFEENKMFNFASKCSKPQNLCQNGFTIIGMTSIEWFCVDDPPSKVLFFRRLSLLAPHSSHSESNKEFCSSILSWNGKRDGGGEIKGLLRIDLIVGSASL